MDWFHKHLHSSAFSQKQDETFFVERRLANGAKYWQNSAVSKLVKLNGKIFDERCAPATFRLAQKSVAKLTPCRSRIWTCLTYLWCCGFKSWTISGNLGAAPSIAFHIQTQNNHHSKIEKVQWKSLILCIIKVNNNYSKSLIKISV